MIRYKKEQSIQIAFIIKGDGEERIVKLTFIRPEMTVPDFYIKEQDYIFSAGPATNPSLFYTMLFWSMKINDMIMICVKSKQDDESLHVGWDYVDGCKPLTFHTYTWIDEGAHEFIIDLS